MPKEIKNLVCFTYYGEGMSVAQHAIDEGLDAVLAVIQDHADILTSTEKKAKEPPDEKELRLKIGTGIVPVVDADKAVKNLMKVPMNERGSYFLLFDINVGFKYATMLAGQGFEGNFPTEDDRSFEVDRDKGKQFVKDHYAMLKVGEIQEFKKVDDALTFLETTDASWVLKGYDDLCETVVPNKQDPEKDKVQLVSALNNGQKDYEKSGFLLEKMIYDQCEITPEAIFHDGILVAASLDIELKRKFAGDLGPNCGCAANLIIPLSLSDPIVQYAFPSAVLDLARQRKGVFLWDASILNDPEDNEMYFGEFCPNRFGWDSIQTEMTMAGGVSKYLNAIINNESPFKMGTFGFSVRLFAGSKDPDIAIEISDEVKQYAWPMYVHKVDDKIAMSGYSDDAIVVTCVGDSIIEAVNGAYKYVEEISLKDAIYRPKEDILSRSYPAALLNRYDYAKNEGLFNDETEQDIPQEETKGPAPVNMQKYFDRLINTLNIGFKDLKDAYQQKT